jgi:hypothetical protein
MPIEQLAQLLVQYARANAALPRRTPANDDALHAQYVDDMFHRIEALPELRREAETMRPDPQLSSPMVPTTAPASNEDLEELVAIALESAQDAADISREAHEASRRAKHGMFVAIALAAVGIAIAGAATISARLYDGGNQQMADIARQVQTLGDVQRHINDRLADLHAAPPVQEADAAPAPPANTSAVQTANAASAQHANAAPVQQASAAPVQQANAAPITAPPQSAAAPLPLAPLKTIPVTVLPAVPAMPQPAPATTDSSQSAAAAPLARTEAPTASFAPAASYAAYVPPLRPPGYTPRVPYHGSWTPYHPRPRRYQTVVLPRPVLYLIGTVQRDVRLLLR